MFNLRDAYKTAAKNGIIAKTSSLVAWDAEAGKKGRMVPVAKSTKPITDDSVEGLKKWAETATPVKKTMQEGVTGNAFLGIKDTYASSVAFVKTQIIDATFEATQEMQDAQQQETQRLANEIRRNDLAAAASQPSLQEQNQRAEKEAREERNGKKTAKV